MANVSIFIIIIFILTTICTVWLFYKATRQSKIVLYCILLYMVTQSGVALTGFYLQQSVTPPRFIFLIAPGLLVTILLFTTKKGRQFVDGLDIKYLTLLHSVRVPVELTLYTLFLAKLIPILMTFEGYNYDIFSGLTAPVIYYLVFNRKLVSPKILLAWNFLCLSLLLIIVVIALLSAQTPFQRLAFEQPNVGVTYFPFVWLPGIIVPLVLIAHLAAIRLLTNNMNERVSGHQ